MLTVEIVGEGRANEPFSRGVYRRYPTIGDEVHPVNGLLKVSGKNQGLDGLRKELPSRWSKTRRPAEAATA